MEIFIKKTKDNSIMPDKFTTIQQYPLEQRKVVKKTISALFIWLTIFLVVLVLHSFFWETFRLYLLIIDIIFILILIAEPIYQYYYYKKYFYDVRTDFLVIRKGVIMVRETILNYDKIQDVYMDQDILDRVFGLHDVHVSTATAMSGYEAHIDGVNQNNALAIKEQILEKIRSKKPKNG